MKGILFKKITVAAIASCMALGSMAGLASAAEATEPEGKYSLSYSENIVTVEGGQILGRVDNDVYTYLGIPYAKAERFQMPEKPDSWEGIKPCLVYKEVSPQVLPTTVGNEKFWTVAPLSMEYQNENCQYLNVWSTDLEPETPKAVMVFFHGGGYSAGSATECIAQDLSDMAKYGDVVTVSVNHRLNVFGFMDVSDYGEEYKYSGNAGVGDMIAALEWVRDNIAQFGGDPENVTIFGQSGGGGKVTTLLGVPSAKGLFHKAIAQSGGSSNRSQESAKADTAAIMEYLGVTTIDELLAVSTQDLVDAYAAVGGSFGPTVDGDFYPVATFADGVYSDLSSDIPTMIGTTFGEFASNGVPIVGEDGISSNTEGMTEEEVLAKLADKYTEEYAADILEAFKKAYPDHDVKDALYCNFRAWNAEESASYTGFALGKDLGWSAIEKSKVSEAPVYSYVFAWTYPIFGGVTATHGADLAFCFHTIDRFKTFTQDSPVAYELQDVVCTAWTNFAKTGDPSQEGITWDPITEENGAVMIFDANSEVRYFHDKELMELMNKGTAAASAASEAEANEAAEPAEDAE